MENTQNRKLAVAAIIVMTSTVLSRILGFIRTTLITNIHYLNVNDKDALFMSFAITDVMFFLLVGGSIASVLIPMLSRYISNGDEKNGWRAVSSFINIMFIAITVFSILGEIFAPQLISLVAPGFGKEKAELTVQVTRIMFPSVSFIMLTGLLNGVLYSYHRYVAAAYGTLSYNVFCIISIIVFSRYGVKMVAVGIMCSSILYFLFQLTFTLKNLKLYRPKIYLKDPGLKKLVLLSIPSLIASSIAQINILVSQSYNSYFPDGSVTALRNATDIWQMPYGIFALGLGVAILPSLSEMLAKNDMDSYRSTLVKSLKSMLLLIIPSAVGLAVLGVPATSVIYKWSARMSASTINITSTMLMFFSIALVSQSIVAIVNRAFYANNDTKTPLYIGASSIALNAILCFGFFKLTNLSASGMALAFSISSAIYALLLLWYLNRKVGGLKLRNLLNFSIRVFGAALVMAVILFVINKLIPVDFTQKFTLKHKILELVIIAAEIGFGFMIFMAAAIRLKIEEAVYLYNAIISKMKGLLGRTKVKEIGKM